MKNKTDNIRLYAAMRLIMLGVVFDQLTKMLAVMYLTKKTFIFIPNFLRLELVYNTGMAFGLLANARLLFLVMTIVALVIGWRYYREYAATSRPIYWGGILFFAGALGNFFDRLFYGKVTDFIAVQFGAYQFPVFNVADSFLCLSIVFIIGGLILEERKGEEEK